MRAPHHTAIKIDAGYVLRHVTPNSLFVMWRAYRPDGTIRSFDRRKDAEQWVRNA